MYYVIKKQHNKLPSTFLGFATEKYIASKANRNIIFLFNIDGKVVRKWVKLDDIILLTEDKEYFLKIMREFRAVEEQQKKLVEAAQKKLEESMITFSETMQAHINDYEEIRDSSDVPDILKHI